MKTWLRRPLLVILLASALTASMLSAVMAASADGEDLLASEIREGDVRFKVTCKDAGQLNDDPIVYPNQPGAAHMHDFFGKTGVDAFTTTYDMLVNDDDDTSCNDPGDLASYWAPALITSDQGIVTPTRMTTYYRRGSKNGLIQPYPDGLKVIAGWKAGEPTPPVDIAGWQCGDSTAVHFRQPSPPLDCGTDHMHAYVRFPDCWDGVNVDSPDHRSHMAYSAHDNAANANVCPPSHPVQVPQLTTYVNYRTVNSGSQIVGLASGGTETLHADFFNGWDRDRLIERIETCLNGLVRCESGGGDSDTTTTTSGPRTTTTTNPPTTNPPTTTTTVAEPDPTTTVPPTTTTTVAPSDTRPKHDGKGRGGRGDRPRDRTRTRNVAAAELPRDALALTAWAPFGCDIPAAGDPTEAGATTVVA